MQYPGLHPRIDELERRLIDKGQSAREISRRLKLPLKEVRLALRAVGLEVDSVVKTGYVSSSRAVCTAKAVDTGVTARWNVGG